jgi:hypothetical protein
MAGRKVAAAASVVQVGVVISLFLNEAEETAATSRPFWPLEPVLAEIGPVAS